ncbi:transglutaminase family protein [Gymnodinialimonas sp. 2305UL16-5]|uniref:transglutaminase family protein n=1 Tax=Gymnodinialimonas mytili TaxID=3126503 RepID=UPI00309794CD
MKLQISHTTRYRFEAPAIYGLQQLRLTPQTGAGQSVAHWDMQVEGGTVETAFLDHHKNRVTLVSFKAGATEVRVTCTGQVETEDRAGIIGKTGDTAPLWFFERSTDLTKAGSRVRSLVKGLKDEEPEDIARLHALSSRILAAVPYEIGATEADTTAEDAIDHGAGVCQDHAHIFLAAVRYLGYPARYVSGYLMMDDRHHQDASHAWAEVHINGMGWVGFDVSNRISPDDRYVRVATGLDYTEAAPIAGLHYGASGEEMQVDIEVQQQ